MNRSTQEVLSVIVRRELSVLMNTAARRVADSYQMGEDGARALRIVEKVFTELSIELEER